MTGSPPAWRGLRLAEEVRPFGQMLLRGAERWPGEEALVFPDSRHTYAELATESWQIAESLVALGVRPRQRVGLLMTNHPTLISSLAAIALMGAVAVPINARYRTEEVRFLLEDCELSGLLTHDAAAEHVDFAGLLLDCLPGLAGAADPRRLELAGVPELDFVVQMGDSAPAGMVARAEFDGLADVAARARLRRWAAGVSLRQVALILYTSGTTAQPRGAMLSHEGLVRTWVEAGRRFGCGEGERFWCALPLFHMAAIGTMTFSLALGATFISDHRFDAERALEQIEGERATLLYPTYPAVIQDMVTHPRFAETDLSAVKAYCAIAPPETLAECQRLFPDATQITTYGGTEAGIVTMSDIGDPLEERIATCGRPLPGLEIEIVDPRTLRPLPVGEAGEILMRGYNTFDGYYNHPEKTAEACPGEGWIRMGDRGVLDAEGRLLFLGRIKEMLKVGGENVAPAEIEAQLLKHPAVKLAQVVGIPDPRLDEVAAAFVELVPGEQASEQELIESCRGRIASFKLPRLIRFVEEWPMSATKIQRFELRERLLAELGFERPATDASAVSARSGRRRPAARCR